MEQLLILADDLSGAADCGIACAASGLATFVAFGAAPAGHGADVLAIDADTRARPPHEAAATTARLLRDRGDGVRLFKKLDSTLRGNWPEELAAIRAIRPQAPIVLAPAFPATGRTTAGGRQFLDGVPLETSELGRREAMRGPVRPADMLRRAGLQATAIGLAAIRGGGAALARGFAAADILVCDAETEDDLARIAAAAAARGGDTIWAGSAGLARHLPAAIGLRGTEGAIAHPPAEGPLLFVVGSLSRRSREQAVLLGAAPGVATLGFPPDLLRLPAAAPPRRQLADRLAAALAAGDDVIALLGDAEDVDPAAGLALCTALAGLVAPFAPWLGGLVCTGGETARAVLSACGAHGLRLVGEVEPGVPLGITLGGPTLTVITKAGAFGRADTLLRCRAVLRAPERAAALHVTLQPPPIPQPQERRR
jgi:4-hydroxythreonine-4-phosphate dehydrogenase